MLFPYIYHDVITMFDFQMNLKCTNFENENTIYWKHHNVYLLPFLLYVPYYNMNYQEFVIEKLKIYIWCVPFFYFSYILLSAFLFLTSFFQFYVLIFYLRVHIVLVCSFHGSELLIYVFKICYEFIFIDILVRVLLMKSV